MSIVQLPARIEAKYSPEPMSGCWIWLGRVNAKGYSQTGARGYSYAHRWFYELLVGPIPDGLVIDHVCRTRCCVNPAHLEPVTHRENLMRGETIAAMNAAKTHCKNGHAFSEHGEVVRCGTYLSRRCIPCRRERQRKVARKKRAELRAQGLSSRGRPLTHA